MISSDEFLSYCRQGLTLTQIAVRANLSKEELVNHFKSTDELKLSWSRGKELCQAFHEDLLDQMMSDGSTADTKDRDLQRWRLEVRFPNDWSEKSDQNPENISELSNMSTSEIENKIKNLINLPHIQKIINK